VKGACHCGAVTLTLAEKPDYLFDCNCSLCRKHGVLWGYFDPAQVTINGETESYARADRDQPAVNIHFCGTCGCSTHWTPAAHIDQKRLGANMRLFDAEDLAGVPLHFPDGAGWDGNGEFEMRRESTVFGVGT
jgi:hypothetical protein